MMDDVRPNEKATPSVQDLRVALAKAYVANQNPLTIN